MLKRKRAGLNVPARIVSTDRNAVVFEIEIDHADYKKGQRAVAVVSTKDKTPSGKTVIVSDVVAQGAIAEVDGKHVTIRSGKYNPIVSQRAVTKAKNNSTKVNVRIFQ